MKESLGKVNEDRRGTTENWWVAHHAFSVSQVFMADIADQGVFVHLWSCTQPRRHI